MSKHYIYRWGFFLIGLMVMSLGIAMTIKGQRLGVGPWDVLHVGLYNKFNLSIGSWNVITGVIIILLVSIVLRELPKIGTWINMAGIGIFIDLFIWLLLEFTMIWVQIIILHVSIVLSELPKIVTWINMAGIGIFIDLFIWLLPEFTTIWAQMIIFILGIIVMGYGAGIYVSPAMGAGPRDSLMLLIVEKYGISIKMVRTMIEVIISIIGWLLGGPIGIGTVIIALLIGQIMHYALPQSQKV